MKIHHIRKNNRVIGTLAAIKNEDNHTVQVGFSVVHPSDKSPSKKRGAEIAIGRAERRRSLYVPHRIAEEFKNFVGHLAGRREYAGYHVPMPEDFIYTHDPLKHDHGH